MALAASQVRSRRSAAVRDLLPRERPLKVVEKRRQRPHRTGRLVVVMVVALTLGSLLAVAGAQAYLTQGQVRLTRLQEQLSTQLGQHRDLELRVAQLEQPANVLSEAQKQGLVAPKEVTDLSQVEPPAPQKSTTSGTPTRPSLAGTAGARAQPRTATTAARSGGR